jgi:predicted nucleotidyltransferase
MERLADRLGADAAQARVLNVLARTPAVQVAYLFGSAARGRLRFSSDLDLAVASNRGPLSAGELQGIRDGVAIAAGRAADVVDLAQASAPVLRAALAGGRQLLCTDRKLLLALRMRLVHETEDFLPYQRRLLAERRRRWTGT